jgi:uncharacterized membrane protein
MYLCLISFLPILISLALVPGYSIELGIMIFVMTPVYLILMVLLLRYIRKDSITKSAKTGKMTAQTGFIFQAIAHISILLLAPIVVPEIVLTGLDFTALILWGASSIINLIAGILYKTPQKN